MSDEVTFEVEIRATCLACGAELTGRAAMVAVVGFQPTPYIEAEYDPCERCMQQKHADGWTGATAAMLKEARADKPLDADAASRKDTP